ncbi:MAG: YsnF/AvaK domain-containing protein, partial [Acidobacteriota bacterium]|nr:YsnF/AvaK domain-containing protein [Acidobacteriota bacterium]
MTQTVIGLFESKTEAQAAMQELVSAGFAEENIDFSNRRYDETTATDTTSTGGGISGFFNSLFGDDTDEARNYSNVASDAEVILTIQTDSDERSRQIAEILDRNGAIDVDERSSQYQAGYAQSGGSSTATENRTATSGDMTIPVIEEDLQVGKREVQGGGVRVRSRVIEKPVEETLRLREEHIVVNRHPVNREVTDADMSNFKEGDFEITERAEQAVVS